MKGPNYGEGGYEDMDRVEKMDCSANRESLLGVPKLLQPNSWEKRCQPLPDPPSGSS